MILGGQAVTVMTGDLHGVDTIPTQSSWRSLSRLLRSREIISAFLRRRGPEIISTPKREESLPDDSRLSSLDSLCHEPYVNRIGAQISRTAWREIRKFFLLPLPLFAECRLGARFDVHAW